MIRAEHSARPGVVEAVEVADPAELRRVLAGWASAWDSLGTRISSDGHDDATLIAALPLELVSREAASQREADAIDELHDGLSDELELPGSDDRTLLAAVEVNGRRWVLVDQGGWYGCAWLPVLFWDYPLETVYEIETETDGGAFRGTRVYRAAGVTVTITARDHFNARAGGAEEMSLEPDRVDIAFETVDLDPEGLVSDDDPVTSISLTAPALGVEQSAALARQFADRHGPRTSVQVNDCTIESPEDEEPEG